MDLYKQLRIGSNVKYLRQSFGFTQYEMADMLHMCRTSYCSIESGKRLLPTETLVELSRIYNVKTDTILEMDELTFLHKVSDEQASDSMFNHLAQLYFTMSAYAQGQLLERAEILFDKDKLQRLTKQLNVI